MHHEFLPKESKVHNAVLAIHLTVKYVNQLHITNKMECFSFKSGHYRAVYSEAFKRRLAYSVTVIISAYYYI